MLRTITTFFISLVLFGMGSINLEKAENLLNKKLPILSQEAEPAVQAVQEPVYEQIAPEDVMVAYGQSASTSFVISWTDERLEEKALVEIDGVEYEATTIEVETILYSEAYRYYSYAAEISGLPQNDTLEYRIGYGGDRRSEWNKINLPVKESEVSLLFFGDIQGYKQANYDAFRNIYDTAVTTVGTPDLAMLAGDTVDTGGRYEEWQFLQNAMGDLFKRTPVMAAPGNHDTADRNVFDATFRGSSIVDIGSARIAIIDTEFTDTFEEQKKWLKAEMAGSSADFKIVLMHRSVFPLLYDEPYIRKWHSTFEEAGIDLVLSGHDHIYSRTVMDGVAYVCGGSGSGSKYYGADMDRDYRYWIQEVYDTNLPVFVSIEVEENSLAVNSYSVSENQTESIDTLIIEK